MSKLGHFIKFHRERLGLSQEAFGALCGGVSRSAVHQWETGANTPGREKLPAIAAALGIPPEAFEYRLDDVFLSSKRHSLGTGIPLLEEADVLAHLADASSSHQAEDFVRVEEDISPDCYAIRVQSTDLVNEIGIAPGDIVILDPAAKPVNNDIVHAVIDDALVLRVYRYRGRDRTGQPAYDLIATDPEIPTRTGTSSNPIRIVAVMVEHRKRRRLSTER